MRLSHQRIKLTAAAVAAVVLFVGQGASSGAEMPETTDPQTAMGELAASMKPGQWAGLKTSGLNMKVFSNGGHHA